MDQVFRADRYSGIGGNLGRHVAGERRPKTARKREALEAVVHLDDDGEVITTEQAEDREAKAKLYIRQCEKVGQRTRGRKPSPVRGFLVAGLPRYGQHDEWEPLLRRHLAPDWKKGDAAEVSLPDADTPEYRQLQHEVSRAYSVAAIRFVLRRGGPGCRIAQCALHQDEAAPHMHLMVVIADREGRLGWNRVREGFALREGEKRGTYRNEKLMSAMQDRYHEEVASAFGLERGQSSGGAGGARPREPIDREKGMELRLQEENQRLGRAVAKHERELELEREKRRKAAKRVGDALKKGRTEGFGAGIRESESRVAIAEADRDRARSSAGAAERELELEREKRRKAAKRAGDALKKGQTEGFGAGIRESESRVAIAEADRDRARSSAGAAERVRDSAISERDAAVKRAGAAERVRDSAISERDAAVKRAGAAEKARDSAISEREAAQKRASKLAGNRLVAGSDLTAADLAAKSLTADAGGGVGAERGAAPPGPPRERERTQHHPGPG